MRTFQEATKLRSSEAKYITQQPKKRIISASAKEAILFPTVMEPILKLTSENDHIPNHLQSNIQKIPHYVHSIVTFFHIHDIVMKTILTNTSLQLNWLNRRKNQCSERLNILKLSKRRIICIKLM